MVDVLAEVATLAAVITPVRLPLEEETEVVASRVAVVPLAALSLITSLGARLRP